MWAQSATRADELFAPVSPTVASALTAALPQGTRSATAARAGSRHCLPHFEVSTRVRGYTGRTAGRPRRLSLVKAFDGRGVAHVGVRARSPTLAW